MGPDGGPTNGNNGASERYADGDLPERSSPPLTSTASRGLVSLQEKHRFARSLVDELEAGKSQDL